MRRRLRLLLNLRKSAGQNDKPAGVKLTGFGCANNQTQTLMYFANRLTMPSKEPGVVGTLAIWPSRQARKLLLRLIRRVQQTIAGIAMVSKMMRGSWSPEISLYPPFEILALFHPDLSRCGQPGKTSIRRSRPHDTGASEPGCVWSQKSCSG